MTMLVTLFGILGNIISGSVFLSPIPTFYNIYTTKSTENYSCLSYIVALVSAILWLYYALLKGHELFLITINCIGCIIQCLYITIYCAYSTTTTRAWTSKTLTLVFTLISLFVLLTQLLLTSGTLRQIIVGVICVVFSLGVFAAPLSIIVQAIQSNDVKYMSLALSFTLTLSAIVWFGYGLVTRDIYIWLPNIGGFLLSLLQTAVYGWIKCTASNP